MSFWSGRRVLLTGGTGFLGYWLGKELVSRDAEVIALIRDLVPRAPFFTDGIGEQVMSVRGSVEDQPFVRRVLHEYEIEVVFHLAAQSIVGVANRDPVATFETNIRGTWCVLDACREYGRVSRVVIASSDKAYGEHDQLPYAEDFPLQGRHPYDVSKSCADLIASTYHHTYALPVSITRCGNIFGPGDLNFSRIVPGTIKSVINGERPIIRSDGSPIRDYVHVSDVVSGYLMLAEAMDRTEIHGRGFNLGTGEPKTVLELIRLITSAAGRDDLEPEILDQAKAEIQNQYLGSELARELLGWQPATSVSERLAETVQWYRQFLDGGA